MKKILRLALLILCVGMLAFGGVKLYGVYAEYRTAIDSYDDVASKYVALKEPPTLPRETTNTPIVEPSETETAAETGVAPSDETPLTVDFEALLGECKDVVGWLYCEGTPINYPVVQSRDNDYYLRRLLDGKWNINGSIFLDYRNSADFSDLNSIIYGHNMKNDAMFGCLDNWQSQEFYEEHRCIYLVTPSENHKIELIAGYTTSSTSPETYAFPKTADERDALVAYALSESRFVADVEVAPDDCVVTLSTCSDDYDDARFVLVGVLRD